MNQLVSGEDGVRVASACVEGLKLSGDDCEPWACSGRGNGSHVTTHGRAALSERSGRCP
jgi:hypothetical protein